MSRPSRKLWKQVGTTKQKFDRESDRSPSFDRSSLTKSRQGRSVSSHDSSINKRSDFKSKVQSKIKYETMLQNFCSQINELGIDLMEVPEEDDNIQSLRNSQISMKNDFDEQEEPDKGGLELLNQIFGKKNKYKPKSSRKIRMDKEKIHHLISLVRRMQICHTENQKQIKHQLDAYRNEKKKTDKVLRQVVKRMTKTIYKQEDKIQSLELENQKLREELSDMSTHLTMSQSPRAENKRNIRHTYAFEDDRTVKMKDKKKANLNSIKGDGENGTFFSTDLSNSDSRYKRFSDNNIPVTSGSITPNGDSDAYQMKRHQIESLKNDFDTLSNREKFKKYLQEKKKRELLYEKSDDEDGVKAIKCKKYDSHYDTSKKPSTNSKEPVQNGFSINVNSLTDKFGKKVTKPVKKDHKECNTNTRVERLKSESFLKYNTFHK